MKKELRSAALLLLTAAIWGFAMAAQREGAKYLSPFSFNACRFTVGALALCPLLFRETKKTKSPMTRKEALIGMGIGLILFIASLLQQMGVSDAGAGKAGFLTALYVVLVPILGLFIGKKTGAATWLALLPALPALYLLCAPEGGSFAFAPADLLLLAGAVFWAVHILVTDHFVAHISAIKLCTAQFFMAALLNWIWALTHETILPQNILSALWPILYCGIFSTAVGYTLQTIGQKGCRPALCALILSLESVFCVLAGALLLGERMTPRGYLGCVLMLAAVLLAQAGPFLHFPSLHPKKEEHHV